MNDFFLVYQRGYYDYLCDSVDLGTKLPNYLHLKYNCSLFDLLF